MVSPGDKKASIKERIFTLNKEQQTRHQEFQLNQLTGFKPEQKTQLVTIRNELMSLLFAEALIKTNEERAAFAEKKKYFFESFATFIYSIERNGDINDHAQKLDKLFPSLLGATFYTGIWLHAHQNLPHPLHDMCMAIRFPEPQTSAFPSLREWGKLHAQEMFKQAKLLELYTHYYPVLTEKYGKSLKEISADDFASTIDNAVMNEEMKGIIPEGQRLSDEDMDIVKKVVHINMRFNNKAKYQDVGRVLDVLHQAKNSNAKLPNIKMTSEDLELFEGISMRKLDTYDPVAPLFGKLTGCCQRIGGQGQECAIHSVTSESGGVYVIEWKKSILAGSWAWYSAANKTLCFDSVEIDSQTKKDFAEQLILQGFDKKTLSVEDFINVMYTDFAQLLMKGNPHIEQVLVGTQGQTPDVVGVSAQSNFGMSLVSPDGYPKTGYRDSRTVRVLGRKDDPLYQLHALNQNEIVEKIFKDNKTSSEDFFRVFVNLLDDYELLNEYFIGKYTHIKTVTSLSGEDTADPETIYLIKGEQGMVLAHFYIEEEEGHWEKRTIDESELPANYKADEFIEANHHSYSTIEFFEQVTSLCGLPPSRIKIAELSVPEWFKFVFNKGTAKNYSAVEIRQLIDLVNDIGFMVPGTSETLFYAALVRGDFDTVYKQMHLITKEIIDIGNEEESCLISCAKKLSLSEGSKWYDVAMELLDKGGDPNYGDVNGDGFAHYLSQKISTMDILNKFIDLAIKYKFDLFLPNDDRITPLHNITKSLKINTFAQIDQFVNELARRKILHNLDYLTFAKVLKVNDDDLDSLREYLQQLDWSLVEPDNLNHFFANPNICQKAKILLFENVLDLVHIEQKRAAVEEQWLGKIEKIKPNITLFERLFKQMKHIYTDDLHTYLNAMTVKNVAEYTELKRIFAAAGMACNNSLYHFYKTWKMDDNELKEYMKNNPPTKTELIELTGTQSPQINGFILCMLEPKLLIEEKADFLARFLSSHSDIYGTSAPMQEAITDVCSHYDPGALATILETDSIYFNTAQKSIIIRRQFASLSDDNEKLSLLTNKKLIRISNEQEFEAFTSSLTEYKRENLLSPELEQKIAVHLFQTSILLLPKSVCDWLITVPDLSMDLNNRDLIGILHHIDFKRIDPEQFKRVITDRSKTFVDLCVLNAVVKSSKDIDSIQCMDLSDQNIDPDLLFDWMAGSGNLDFYAQKQFLNGFKSEEALVNSFVSYLKNQKFSNSNSFSDERFFYKRRIDIMQKACSPALLETLNQLLIEQIKQPRERNDFSINLWSYVTFALGRPDPEHFNLQTVEEYISKIEHSSPEQRKEIIQKFILPKDHKISIKDFAELDAIACARVFSKYKDNFIEAEEFFNNFASNIAGVFLKNSIVLDDRVFEAILPRYEIDLISLKHNEYNRVINLVITNLMMRSALSHSEMQCEQLRKKLEPSKIWEEVTLDEFNVMILNDMPSSFPLGTQVEQKIGLYLLHARTKEERNERCDLLLDKLKEIDAVLPEEDYFRRRTLPLLLAQVVHYKQTMSCISSDLI